MDYLSKEFVLSFFNRELSLHGDRPEALRWSPAGQQARFEALLDAGDLQGSKVLDYGCGKGDFYQFLQDKGINVKYSGFDINEKFIALARNKFPAVDFRVLDIEEDPLGEDFDYIFLCGVFNLKVQGLDKTIKNTLHKLFKRCRRGLVFNALSSYDPKKDFELHYTSPEEIFTYAAKYLSRVISIRHDRLEHDFTMFVYKDINSW